MRIIPIAAHQVEPARLLLAHNGWTRKVQDPEQFQLLLDRSQIKLVALDGDQVVGFIRAITDGIFNGYISMVVVAAHWRGKGLGRALVEAAMGTNVDITWVLRADRDGVPAFYDKLGFERSTVAMERRRR